MAKAGYREKKIRPVWPICAAGAIFVLYSALFPIYKPAHFVIASVLALITYVAGTMFAPVKTEQVEVDIKTGDDDADAIITKGRATTARLRATLNNISDVDLKSYVARTERAITSMVDAVAQTPSKAQSVKKFINYYLPTIMKLLDAYDRLRSAGQAQALNSTLISIKESMENVAKASEKQLQNMYEDEQMDISTDIEVLETMLKADGLLGDDPFGKSGK